MAFPCPRCGDRFTQSLPMAYASGTYIRNWRSRSGYHGTTVSQSIVGGLASPSVKRPLWKPLLGLIFVGLFLAPGFTTAWNLWIEPPQQRSAPVPIIDGPRARHRPHRAMTVQAPFSPVKTIVADGEALLCVLGFGVAIAGLLLWWLARSIRFNRQVYPQLMRNWQLSFMCRQCGAVFYPPDASSMVVSP